MENWKDPGTLQGLDEAGYNVETLAVRMARYYQELR